jgi:glutamate N-acetyltransferase/amino-acid N-acetyltransferase
VLVLSTGVIGTFLPMEKITSGIRAAAEQLAHSDDALLSAARGMMTTDTVHKLSGRQLDLSGRSIQVTGMAKGAAMIGPHMATMLSVVITDAPLAAADAQAALAEVVDVTFNCIHVDGHMSTNDTVVLVANGAAGGSPLSGGDLRAFTDALREVCTDLARAIPSDGEGATHLITLDVAGCATVADARRIARTIADSPLVKTAVAGADPNWGRIVSAAGYAGVKFDPKGIDLSVNDVLLYERGAPVAFDAAKVSASIREHRDTHVVLLLREGDAAIRFWTTDMTAEYIRLNADYHT